MNLASLSALATQLSEKDFVARFPDPMLLVKKKLGARDGESLRELDWKVRTRATPFATTTDAHRKPGGPPTPPSVELVKKTPRNPFAGMITVGRAANNDLCFPIESVSKLHAYFQKDGERWVVRDETSSNGTFVNGERLRPGTPAPLTDGTIVAFGPDTECLFKTPAGLYAYLRMMGTG